MEGSSQEGRGWRPSKGASTDSIALLEQKFETELLRVKLQMSEMQNEWLRDKRQLLERVLALERELSILKASTSKAKHPHTVQGIPAGVFNPNALALAAPWAQPWGPDSSTSWPSPSPVALPWNGLPSVQDTYKHWGFIPPVQSESMSDGTSRGYDSAMGYRHPEAPAPDQVPEWSEWPEELDAKQHQEQLLELQDEDPGAIVVLLHTTALARMYSGRAIGHIRAYFLKLGIQVKRVSLYMHLDAVAKEVDSDPGTTAPQRQQAKELKEGHSAKRTRPWPQPPRVGYVILNSTQDVEIVLQLPREHVIARCAICMERFKPELAWPELM